MNTFLSVIAGLVLAVVSNWLYDIGKAKGLFPRNPSLKRIIVTLFAFSPFVILVALPNLNEHKEPMQPTNQISNSRDITGNTVIQDNKGNITINQTPPQTEENQQNEQEQPDFPLLSGNYIADGSINSGSRFVVAVVGKRICVAMTSGVPSPYAGEYRTVVSSVSWQNGKFYLDSVGKPLEQPENVSSYFDLEDLGVGGRAQWRDIPGETKDKDYIRPCLKSNTSYVVRDLPGYTSGNPDIDRF